MEQAFFTGIKDRIIPLISKSSNNVKIAMAWFTNNELFQSLLQCLKRGIKVELILLDDYINFMEYAPDFNLFIQLGGNLRIAKSDVGFMHHKFCIIDDKIVITGSYNWTYYAEIRNIENIIISDKNETVSLFKEEFTRLANKIKLCTICYKLSWDVIQEKSDIDYKQLNYEIEQICTLQQKTVRKVFHTNVEVVRRDIKLIPYSSCAIGLAALDDNDNEVFDLHIPANVKLPYKSKVKELYFDSTNTNNFPCSFICGDPNNLQKTRLLKKVDLMQIVNGVSQVDLKIQFTMNLDDNGSLRIDVVCMDTGEEVTISTLDKGLVRNV